MTANGCGPHPRWQAGCPACQTQARMYDRRRRSAIADGTWLHAVDGSDVQAHIDILAAAGMSVATIAQAAGLAKSTVLGVKKRQFVQGPTAAAILAVHPAVPQTTSPALRAGMVPVVGPSRRVQALAWMGWSLQAQADRMGMFIQQVWQIAHAKQSSVTTATDRTVRDLFEQWSATRGPSSRAHNAAVRSGWVPPLAWDNIDDLDSVPDLGANVDVGTDEVAVRRALNGERVPLNTAETVEVLRAATDRGEHLSTVSNRLGVNYFGARKMLAGELTPVREKRARVEAALLRSWSLPDSHIAALEGVQHQTVTRARRRLEKVRAA